MNEQIKFPKQEEKVYKSTNSDNANMLPGDHKRSPDESFFPEKTLVFIDEAFLSKLSRYFGDGKHLKFDRISFAENISKKQNLAPKKLFLYIAPPFQNSIPSLDDEKRRAGYDNFIKKLRNKGVVVREGRCQRLKVDGKFEYRQKAVDVLLAMDLTNTLINFPKIKKIILISSDSDFVPIIKNLEKNNVRTILYTFYEGKRNTPFSRSNELIKSVYKYTLLHKEDLLSNQINHSNQLK